MKQSTKILDCEPQLSSKDIDNALELANWFETSLPEEDPEEDKFKRTWDLKQAALIRRLVKEIEGLQNTMVVQPKELQSIKTSRSLILSTDGQYALCIDGGMFHHWILFLGAEGQWVPLRPAIKIEIDEAEIRKKLETLNLHNCKRCGQEIEPDSNPDGCRDPDCPYA